MTGTVTLVGAGPGDKGLLTTAGAQAIAQADAVVYDRLVGEDILDLITPHAEKVPVGKENNHHPVPQHEINDILVRLAQAGNERAGRARVCGHPGDASGFYFVGAYHHGARACGQAADHRL